MNMSILIVKRNLFGLGVAFIITCISVAGVQLLSSRVPEQSIFAIGTADVVLNLPIIPSSEAVTCHPGSGRTWTRGPSKPEVAGQVQQTLEQMGIETLVEASSYGETDSCGTFRLHAIDFIVTVNARYPANDTGQQEFAKRIYSVLTDYGQPNLGNAKIAFMQGDTIYFSGEVNDLTILDSRTESHGAISVSTQVDASLTWQDTGFLSEANNAIAVEVVSGLWTHQVGVEPYNNGVGGSYICTDYLPPNECGEPMPEVPQGALIGKIGSHLFAIGSETTVATQQSGNLYLCINDGDDGLYDNDGILTLDITASSPHRIFLPLVMRSYAPSEVFNRKVYVIVYDPLLSNGQKLSTYRGWNNHADLSQGTIDFFGQATNDRLNYSVVYTSIITDGWPEKTDGFRYTEEEYLAVIEGQSQPHSPDTVDYNKIVNSLSLDICGKVNRGEIDEVWIYNGPYFGFYESTLVGPGAYWYNSPPVSGSYDCNRLIPIMGPSPERDLDSAVHNFGHRTESTMTKVYGSWQQNRTAHSWEKFALVKALSPDYFYSGCGNIHYPPNGTSDYNYNNDLAALSNCDDFANYPDLGDPAETAKSVTCSDWDCTQIGYLAYWFGHLPANNGCGPDTVANDWWKYFVDPALALDPSSPCQ